MNAVDSAVAAAQNLPDLVANLEAVDPTLAEQLTAKPLLASRTPWGTLLCAVVAWVSARYGIGLDPNATALVAGMGVLAGSYAMRYVTRRPVTV